MILSTGVHHPATSLEKFACFKVAKAPLNLIKGYTRLPSALSN